MVDEVDGLEFASAGQVGARADLLQRLACVLGAVLDLRGHGAIIAFRGTPTATGRRGHRYAGVPSGFRGSAGRVAVGRAGMSNITQRPDTAVSPATTAIAPPNPTASATRPAISAPTT